MAKPRKNTEKLSKQLTFRIAPSEHSTYLEKVTASGLSSSDFFRDVVLRNKTKIHAVVRMNDDQFELIRYFRAASNNLNQLAKLCHIDNRKGALSDTSYLNLLRSLQSIESWLRQGL
jgi:hypothetical protein